VTHLCPQRVELVGEPGVEAVDLLVDPSEIGARGLDLS